MRLAIRALVLAQFLLLVYPLSASESELKLKSAYILQFTQYVEWPADALPAQGPFKISYYGGEGLLQELRTLAGKKQIQGRAIEISTSSHKGAHMILADPADRRWGRVAADVLGKPMLLINVAEKEENSPFVIQFFIAEGRLRFEISQGAAKNQKLRLSSQLLKLAVVKD